MLKHSPILQLIIACIIFGVGSLFVVFIQLDPTVIAFYRLLIGTLLFAATLLLFKQTFRINARALLCATVGGTMFGADLALWNQSIMMIGPGIATILNSLQVFFMAGFGVMLFGNKPNKRLLLSLIISFLGVILLSSHEVNHTVDGAAGVIYGVLSAIVFALSMLGLRQAGKVQTNGVINTMFYASLTGAIATGVVALGLGKSFIALNTSSWMMVALYGSVVHVLAWTLMAKNMPLLPVALVGLIFLLEPLVVVVVDILFLNKSFTLLQVIGAILTFSAIYVGSQIKSEKS